MKKAAAHTTSLQHKQPTTKLRISRVLFDTAWRIGVPVVAGSVLGLVADSFFGSKPWLSLLGVTIGLAFAGLLVKQQVIEDETSNE